MNTLTYFGNAAQALHHSSFAVASVISTTGYATVDFNLWPEFSKTILVTLMFIGACAGSTGGGMKVSRIIIMIKILRRELVSMIHPKSVQTISANGRRLDDESIRHINGYLLCFIAIFVISILIISLDGFSFETNVTAIAATLNNIGPGLGMVGPAGNFADFSILSKIVFIINMICGRLELFPMMILILPHTWRKN